MGTTASTLAGPGDVSFETRTAVAAASEEPWTIRGLLRRHKLAGLVVAAIAAVMVAMLLVALLGAKAGPVRDATTCSQWSSANQDQQAAYARVYFREHGPLRSGQASVPSILAAINDGCAQAFSNDVADSVTVVQAVSGGF